MLSNERLREIRNELRLTQHEFGVKIGLKQDKIKNLETNKHKITPEIALLIEQNYFISGWWLLTGKGEKYLNSEISTQKPIESKEDNRDSEDFILFYDEYEFLDENPTVAVMVNTPKKVYRNNPLLNSMAIGDNFNIEMKENFNNFILTQEQELLALEPFRLFTDTISILKEFLESLKIVNNNLVFFYVIVKNNLFKEDYPLYEDKYVGVKWLLSVKGKKINLETKSRIRNVTHQSKITLTNKDLEKLNIYAYILYDFENMDEKADKNAILQFR